MGIERHIGIIREQLAQMEAGIHGGTPEVLVSCTEAARLLGRSAKTISAMLREHRLDKVTIGPSTGIRLSQVMEIKA